MKIRKLHIHNIASIEDANIHFDEEPLKSSEVFLITGKTGAGKSTILDAICLALFNKTPRLENTSMQGKTKDVDREIKLNNPRQMLRRGTGEGFVELSFEGSNGIDYVARWSVSRARRRPNGNLQNVQQELTRLDTQHTWTQAREIEREVALALGLDFNQFCRTTMLAQGEFTRFLDSTDEEKAAILEKITGVDAYSKIGRKVYEITQSKNEAARLANEALARVKVLSDDELQEMTAQAEQLKAEIEIQRAQQQVVRQKKDWLVAFADLKQVCQRAEAARQLAEEENQAEAQLCRDRLISDWQVSIDARRWLREQADAQSQAERSRGEMALQVERARRLMAGRAYCRQTYRKLQQDNEQRAEWLALEADKAGVYAQAQRIKVLLEGMVQDEVNLKRHHEELVQAQQTKAERLEPQVQAHRQLHDAAIATFGERELALRQEEQAVEEMKIGELLKCKEEWLHREGLLLLALEKWKQVADAEQRQQQTQAEIERLTSTVKTLQKTLDRLTAEEAEARQRMVKRQQEKEAQHTTVDEWAKRIRATLSVGCTCPVCQQRIAEALPAEHELDRLYAAVEQACTEAEQAHAETDSRLKTTQAEWSVVREQLRQKQELFTNDSSLTQVREAATAACRSCGMTGEEKQPTDRLQRLLNDCRQAQQKVGMEIERANGMQRMLTATRERYEQARSAEKQASERLTQAIRALDSTEQHIVHLTKTMDDLLRQKTEKQQEVEELVTADRWQHDWKTQPDAFGEELLEAATQYRETIDTLQRTADGLKRLEAEAVDIDKALETLTALLAPADLSTDRVEEVPQLLLAVTDLIAEVRVSAEHLSDALRIGDERREALTDYYRSHPALTEERLKELSRHDAAHIERETQQRDAIRQRLREQHALLKARKSELAQHESRRPQMDEAENVETLTALLEQTEREIQVRSERRGSVLEALRQDEVQRRGMEEQRKYAAECVKIYEEWDRLNQLIGDATGAKFKKIAQSYVLASLIESAKVYMQTLDSRYTLHVQPGSFVIYIEDAYLGFARRPASTLSGGESFLVSLALALGLSDMGENIAVDTLFIDEGFGTLSGDPLRQALQTLRTLHHKASRHVGIISHVEELKENIPVKIKVEQEGQSSASQVRVVVE